MYQVELVPGFKVELTLLLSFKNDSDKNCYTWLLFILGMITRCYNSHQSHTVIFYSEGLSFFASSIKHLRILFYCCDDLRVNISIIYCYGIWLWDLSLLLSKSIFIFCDIIFNKRLQIFLIRCRPKKSRSVLIGWWTVPAINYSIIILTFQGHLSLFFHLIRTLRSPTFK